LGDRHGRAAVLAGIGVAVAPGLDHCWQRRAPDLHIRMVDAWLSRQERPSELRPEPTASPAAVERLRRETSKHGTEVTGSRPASRGTAGHAASP